MKIISYFRSYRSDPDPVIFLCNTNKQVKLHIWIWERNFLAVSFYLFLKFIMLRSFALGARHKLIKGVIHINCLADGWHIQLKRCLTHNQRFSLFGPIPRLYQGWRLASDTFAFKELTLHGRDIGTDWLHAGGGRSGEAWKRLRCGFTPSISGLAA